MALNWRAASMATVTNDMTFTSQVTGRRLLINTFHPLSDGVSPPRREKQVAMRTVHNGQAGDIVAILPLPPDGDELDEAQLETALRPLLVELDRPPPADDPRDSTPLENIWYLWEPED